jgi:hypothetical protein
MRDPHWLAGAGKTTSHWRHFAIPIDWLPAIAAAVKITSDLERVGDLAVNIAGATRRYLSPSRRHRAAATVHGYGVSLA